MLTCEKCFSFTSAELIGLRSSARKTTHNHSMITKLTLNKAYVYDVMHRKRCFVNGKAAYSYILIQASIFLRKIIDEGKRQDWRTVLLKSVKNVFVHIRFQ